MNPRAKYIDKQFWSSHNISLLGTMPDSALAKKWGIPLSSVFYKRKTSKIPSFRPSHEKKWTSRNIRMLGKKSDQEIANLLGVKKTTVVKKRMSLGIESFARQSKLWREWSPDEIALLGSITDKEIAQRLNIAISSVTSKRMNMGIKSVHPRSPATKKRLNAVMWTRRNISLLGKIPDLKLAEMMGVNRKTIIKKRKALGVPCYTR
jgi:hypothetical protein